MEKLFYREKETKVWREGWIIKKSTNKIQIGQWDGAITGIWYDRRDIETRQCK